MTNDDTTSQPEYGVYVNTVRLDLVGLYEIAKRSGVNIGQVQAWALLPDFPEAAADLAEGQIWIWGPVHLWLRQNHQRGDADLPA